MSEVRAITSAGRRRSDQVHDRAVTYAWMMGIRMICLGLACWIAMAFHSWWAAAPMVGAVVLPWIAVVIANSGAERREVPDTYLDGPSDSLGALQLEAAPARIVLDPGPSPENGDPR